MRGWRFLTEAEAETLYGLNWRVDEYAHFPKYADDLLGTELDEVYNNVMYENAAVRALEDALGRELDHNLPHNRQALEPLVIEHKGERIWVPKRLLIAIGKKVKAKKKRKCKKTIVLEQLSKSLSSH